MIASIKFNKVLYAVLVLLEASLISSCSTDEPFNGQGIIPFRTRSIPQWFTTYTEAVDDLIECQINDDSIECVLLSTCANRLPNDIFNKFCYAAQDQDFFETTEYCWQNTAYLAIETIEWREDEMSGFLKPGKVRYTLYVLMGSKSDNGDLFSYQIPDNFHEYIRIFNEYDE